MNRPPHRLTGYWTRSKITRTLRRSIPTRSFPRTSQKYKGEDQAAHGRHDGGAGARLAGVGSFPPPPVVRVPATAVVRALCHLLRSISYLRYQPRQSGWLQQEVSSELPEI